MSAFEETARARIQAVLHRLHEELCPRRLETRRDLGVIRRPLGAAETHVFAERQLEPREVLEEHAHVRPEIEGIDVPEIGSRDADAAAVRVVEPDGPARSDYLVEFHVLSLGEGCSR